MNPVDQALDKAALKIRLIKDLLAWQRRQACSDLWAEIAVYDELFVSVRDAAIDGHMHCERARTLLRERMQTKAESPVETPLGDEIDGGSEA